MLLICCSVLFLSGCTYEEASDYASAIVDSVGTDSIQPQGNQRDYLLQDYNVKKVQDVRKSTLKKYDVSGPDYSGVSEIITNGSGSADDTEDNKDSAGICVTAYHTNGKLAGQNNWFVCKNVSNSSKVLQALSSTEFYKDGDYSESSDVNEVLKDAYAYSISGGTNASELISKLASLKSAGILTNARISASSSDYKVESTTNGIVMSAVQEASFTAVATDSTQKSGLSGVEAAEYATASGASAHVVVAYKCSQRSGYKNVDGWTVYYLESVPNSASLADAIVKELRGQTALTEATSTSSSGTRFNGKREVSGYWGNSDKFTILSYATVPTVVVAINLSDSSDKKVAVTAKAIGNGVVNFLGGDDN